MLVNEIDINKLLDESESQEEAQKKALEIFSNKLMEDNNYLAKTIAAYVRMNIEDFHSEHLSDKQMKELNPLIRNAIFSFWEDWDSGRIGKIWGVRMLNCPEYWEDCEYMNL